MQKAVVTDAAGVSQKTNTIKVNERFLLNSLTSTNYNPMTALDELVDNPLDAGSTDIEITILKDSISVKDNGCGMSYDKLIESMNLGSDREYEEGEIGYFGTGMKSGFINILDLQNDNARVDIETCDGHQISFVTYQPSVAAFSYTSSYIDAEEGTESYTLINIHFSKKIQPGAYKNKLATYFYPALKSGSRNIIVNGEMIQPNDPLYRDQDCVMKNFVTAKVLDEKIKVEAVLLNDMVEKHSWDRNSSHDKWAYTKAGVYLIYGNRYLNAGDMMGVAPNDPWYSRTRVEITVPKKYTKIFNIPFNKTGGIADLNAPELSDLKQKVKDMFNWGRTIRKNGSKEVVSNEMKQEQEKLNDKINKIAQRAGVKKPISKEKKQEIRAKKKLVSFEADPNKIKNPSEPKKKTESVIKKSKLFDFQFDDLGNEFWQIGWSDDVFTIVMNNTHPFYNDIYQRMDEETKLSMMNFMASLGMAQYSTIEHDSVCGTEIMDFWSEYWFKFSFDLKRMIQNS